MLGWALKPEVNMQTISLILFKGYRAATDSKFVEYIETKEELYLNGGDMDEDTLILLALNN